MVLTVHHLEISQSERIVWLCEELGIDYKLVKHTRSPILAPDSLKSLAGNASGKAPFVEDSDTDVTLSESSAICDYIIHRYGGGRLSISPTADAKVYADYLYWFHWANGTLQPAMMTGMFLDGAHVAKDDPMQQFSNGGLHGALQQMDDRLKECKWLAGEEFTVADIMPVYSLTTQRYFGPLVSLARYKNVLRFLKHCSERDGFKRAMEKGDPAMKVLLEAEAPKQSIMEAGGTESAIWKK